MDDDETPKSDIPDATLFLGVVFGLAVWCVLFAICNLLWDVLR